MTLFDGLLKKRTHADTEVLMNCKTERERLHVLESFFGISLSADEKRGIKGMVTELKG